MDRRDFLKHAALAGVALTGAACDKPAENTPIASGPGIKPKKVIVLGAGMAGLTAAYELLQGGHDVTVIEARDRPGGRIETLREPFADGLHAEAGAFWIPHSDNYTLHYARLLGLPLQTISLPDTFPYHHVRGKTIQHTAGANVDWPYQLTAEEQTLGLSGMLLKYLTPGMQQLGNIMAPDWPAPEQRKYDQMSFKEYLRGQGASEEAIALLRVSYFDQWGDGIDSCSALTLLRDAVVSERSICYNIQGGNDLLPKALADKLGARLLYKAPVVKIEHDPRGVRATSQQDGAARTLAGDYLICTIPFSVLKAIPITPRLSPEKHRAIDELPYTSVTRVFLQMRQKPWINGGITGYAATDLPIAMAGDATFNQASTRGLLESYMSGPEARRVAAMSEPERIAFTLEYMEKLYPDVRANFEKSATKSWDDDPWARGAHAWFKPGQMTALNPHIARPEGRIHFAGEHASPLPGWIQGAVHSGNRAAGEVHLAV